MAKKTSSAPKARSAKANFKSTQEGYQRVVDHIAKRTFKPIYLLMGSESYFIDKLSKEFERGILSEDEAEFNLHVVYGKDTSGAQIGDMARQYPMMSSHSVVVVRHAQECDDLDMLTHYCARAEMMPPSTILVLCFVGKSMDKRSQLYKQIAAVGEVFESVTPRDYEILPWLEQYFKGRNLAIDSKAIAMLVENLGTDLLKIDSQIDRLLNSIPENQNFISPQDIETYIGISKDFNTFELTRALSYGDSLKALRIVDYFENNRDSGNIYGAFSLIFTHFSRIFALGMTYWDLRRKGLPIPESAVLAKQLSLPSAVFLKEYNDCLARYDTARSFEIIGLIRKYELMTKGVDSGSMSAADALRELIIKILV